MNVVDRKYPLININCDLVLLLLGEIIDGRDIQPSNPYSKYDIVLFFDGYTVQYRPSSP